MIGRTVTSGSEESARPPVPVGAIGCSHCQDRRLHKQEHSSRDKEREEASPVAGFGESSV